MNLRASWIRCSLYLQRPETTRRSTSCCGRAQIIRPTGLLDPEVEVRPVEGQIDDLIGEINKETAARE